MPSRPGRLATAVVAVGFLLAACAPSGAMGGDIVGAERHAATTTSSPAGAGASATSTSTAPSTSTTTSTTTTTTQPPQLLTVAVEPVAADVTVTDALGVETSAASPYEAMVQGPATVTVAADGYQSTTTSVELASETSLTLWVDKPGQLLHKLSQFDTAGAPKQVAFRPGHDELWVTLLSGAGFQVFDPISAELIAAVDLPEAGSVEVIFNREGTLAYVSQMETASVYEVDAESKHVIRRLPTNGVWTKVMVLSPDEQTLWASNWVSNDVSEIDLATGEVTRRLDTVATPRGLYVTPDGTRLYVAGFEDGEIQVFDLATGEADVIYKSGGAMRHLVGDPATGLIYASDMARANVLVVDPSTNDVRELAKVDRVPNTIDLSPDGRVLYVSNRGRNNPETYYKPGPEWGTVVVIDTATGNYLDAIVGGNQTTGLDVSPDGALLAYSDFLDDRVSVYRIPSYETFTSGSGGRWEAHLVELVK